ncbi:ammonium transporter [Pelagibacterium sediminicola]|uniref:ammonium transporter n=1 Tax=Pelagibacterium sediminicola TaxID=2248761 RepID=UPI000E31919D|nr:ammonium transporter [Pelagibacterium sediminicola]
MTAFPIFKPLVFAALASLSAALPALGQDGAIAGETAIPEVPIAVKYILDSFIMVLGGILVMWMAAGFAMLESGLVRSKNVSMQLLKNVAMYGLVSIVYYLIGYKMMYPGDQWLVPGLLGGFGIAVLEPVGLAASEADLSYATVSSDFFFQVMFCATAASIVSGTVAERIRLSPFLVFVFILTGLIYPIQAAWHWGGGFLSSAWGFSDFAGSTTVHSVGGWAALAGALVLGARNGKYNPDGTVNAIPGSNMPLATLGMFILWMGWFGFNGASQLAIGSVGDIADVGRVMANTNAAAAGGAITALILTMLVYGKTDLTFVLNGALAGLVSITAEPLYPGLGTASLIGAVGGVIVVFTVPLLDRLRIDDVVGAIPVHLFAGIWGTIVVVLTNPDATIGAQIGGIAIVGLFTFSVSAAIWFALKLTMGLRPSADDEALGLDKAEIGVEAYPEF